MTMTKRKTTKHFTENLDCATRTPKKQSDLRISGGVSRPCSTIDSHRVACSNIQQVQNC